MMGWAGGIPALHPEGSQVPESVGRVAFLLLAGYVLVLPTAGTVALRNALFFSALLLTLFAAVRWKVALRLPYALQWVVYAAVAFASLAHAIDPTYSLGEIKAEVLYGIVATLLAATWFTRTEVVEKLLGLLLMGSVVMALVSCWQGVREYFLEYAFDPARLGSLHSGAGDYSTYIVVVMPFLLGMLWRHRKSPRVVISISVVIALNLVGAMITRNRAVFPALAIEVVVLVLMLMRVDATRDRWRKLLPWIALFVLTIIGLFAIQIAMRIDVNPISGPLARDPRWEIWTAALENMRANPWFGGGFGRAAFSFVNPEVVQQNGQHWHAHNALLDKGVQMGIPGVLAFAWLIFAAARGAWLKRHAAVRDDGAAMLSACGIALVAGLLVKNTTDDFFVRDQGWLFWVLMAAIASSIGPLRHRTAANRSIRVAGAQRQ